jgi:hypothetical protein
MLSLIKKTSKTILTFNQFASLPNPWPQQIHQKILQLFWHKKIISPNKMHLFVKQSFRKIQKSKNFLCKESRTTMITLRKYKNSKLYSNLRGSRWLSSMKKKLEFTSKWEKKQLRMNWWKRKKKDWIWSFRKIASKMNSKESFNSFLVQKKNWPQKTAN